MDTKKTDFEDRKWIEEAWKHFKLYYWRFWRILCCNLIVSKFSKAVLPGACHNEK